MYPCSELLDEGSEPFEVMPEGCIGPSLVVALFVICADEQVFDQWTSIDDALECMRCAETSAQSAPLNGDVYHHSGIGTASKKEVKRSMHDCAQNEHAEQVGITLPDYHLEAAGQGSKRKSPIQQEPCQTSVHGSSGQEGQAPDSLQHGSAEIQAQTEKAWQPSIIVVGKASKSLINTRMAACMRPAIDKRLSLYRQTGLQADLLQLQEAEQQCSRLGYCNEHWKAVVAALRLVVQEKEMLLNAQAALQTL